MKQYLAMLKHILDNGEERGDRTGTGTIGVFGYQTRYNLSEGFPLLTTKKVHLRSITHELLWFLSGDTNTKKLQDNKVRIWDDWATTEQTSKFGRKEGDLGPVYGHQWRNYGASVKEDGTFNFDGIDQITNVINSIKNNPNSRRHIVTGWNPKEADQVALPPCHTLFQFYVSADGEKLSSQLYQRSADVFLGVPFNIASYSLLTMMVAQVTGKKPGEFIHSFGDLHLYKNHVEQAKLQLSREVKPMPFMKLNPNVKNILDFKYEDFKLENYDPHPHIKGEVSV